MVFFVRVTLCNPPGKPDTFVTLPIRVKWYYWIDIITFYSTF